jgi:hypothetical protein
MSWRQALPGGGFALLVASWGGLAGLLAWGLAEPDLDRAWRILERTDQGTSELSAEDAEVLERCIGRHPEIALDRLGGKRVKHLARTAGGWSTGTVSYFLALRETRPGLRLAVEARCAQRYPLTVNVEAGGARCRLVYEADGLQECVVPLPSPGAAERPVLGHLVAGGGFGCGAGEGPAGLRFADPARGGER